MSATLPPSADADRASDFGEFWRHTEAAPYVPSVLPESEIPLPPLSPEQHGRRQRLRRAVGGLVLGLLAFTALAACVYVVKSRSAANGSAEVPPKPVVAAATSESESTRTSTATATAVAESTTMLAAPTETDQALALANAPVATLANFETWSRLAGRLSPADRHRAEHDLSHLSVKGPRSAQEAARLELALLWRATARRAKAQKVLVSLARTASDPLVKKYALETLSAV